MIGAGTVENGALNLAAPLLNDPGLRQAFAQSVLTTGQGDRCPGSMERGPSGAGSSAASYQPTSQYYESGFPCTPSQVPTGP